AMITLCAAAAEQLTEFKRMVDAKIEQGVKKEKAIYEIVKRLIKDCKAVHFDGNGYSDEWKVEAAKRGLDCETAAPKIFDHYLTPSSLKMFSDTGVFNRTELEARTEVKWETYTKKIQIEARVLGDITMNNIIPVASKYEAVLLDKAYKMKELGLKFESDIELIKSIQRNIAKLQSLVHDMVEARKVANRVESHRERAMLYHDTVAVYFDQIRDCIDDMEEVIDDQLWPLPKYRELLFIR
ncbi:MAG: glutamine synthetase type III, partial [Alistipes sp.]|nr:glutamine synthetase type III [Alistipes sp.]